jgi:hypothetical protein
MEIGPVAITIRNQTTEELIRKIGRRTGEGPSAVITRLVKAEAAGGSNKFPQEEIERRIQHFEELARKYPPPDPKPSWEEVEREMDALFDYLDDENAAPRKRA